MQAAVHRLYYAPQCPNCVRFIGALDRTAVARQVARIDVNTLPAEQQRQVSAVPMLVLSSGQTLLGTRAFEWLRSYEGETELESFAPGRGLAFSDINDDQCAMTYTTPYSAFEPVP